MGGWGQTVDAGHLLPRLKFWCHRAPSEPTFRRLLQSVDSGEIDKFVDERLAAQNEIKGALPLLEGLDLRGQCVTADAMHTHTERARFLVAEKQAEHVLIATGNQPNVATWVSAFCVSPGARFIAKTVRWRLGTSNAPCDWWVWSEDGRC